MSITIDQECLQSLPSEIQAIIARETTNTNLLAALADLAISPKWTETIYTSFEPLFIDICTRWIEGPYLALTVVSAIAKVLPVAPGLSLYAEHLACIRKDEGFRVLFSDDIISLSKLPELDLTLLLNTVLRLLQSDCHTFACLVPLSQLQVLLAHGSPCVRYLAIKIICVFLHASNSAFESMVDAWIGKEEPCGQWDGRAINYRFLPLWEEKRLNSFQEKLKRRNIHVSAPGNAAWTIQAEDLSPNTASFAGVLIPCISPQPLRFPLVMTTTTVRNLNHVARAFTTTRPVMITGMVGSGKTSGVRYLGQRLDQLSTMVTLNLNDQTDAKSLVGMYTSASERGSFKWQPGILTTAVQQGRWVFVEDLDRAPAEVMGMLLPLLERNELLVPHLGGWVRASRGFKLIATIRTTLSGRGDEIDTSTSMLGSRHWERVRVQQLNEDDVSEIIKSQFPILIAYETVILEIYRSLKDFARTNITDVVSARSMPAVGPQQILRFSSRWKNVLEYAGIKASHEPIAEAVQDSMYLEAVDCFSASSRSRHVREKIAQVVAQVMSFPEERAQFCLRSRVPSLSSEPESLQVGRVSLPKNQSQNRIKKIRSSHPFATTNHTLRFMESVGAAIKSREPCLLVGETGTGKTTVVQELANRLGHSLVVVNLSQQSEASDLLGGFKPINNRALAIPLQEKFNNLFNQTLSSASNEKFMKSLERSIRKNEWVKTVHLWQEAVNKVQASFMSKDATEPNPKKKRKIDSEKYQKLRLPWAQFADEVEAFKQSSMKGDKGFAFTFIEGNIVRAVRSGAWVLLDEINLATPDTLETLAGLFPSDVADAPSLILTEAGSVQKIEAHPDFRIFGAMNPATDVGKRDLPPSLRSRFTEYYIDSPDGDQESLEQIIKAYLTDHCHSDLRVASEVATLYRGIKGLEDDNRLVDGGSQKPHFSLRTLTRTLTYANDIASMYGLRRALYEGFSMSFLTFLDRSSSSLVAPLIIKHLFGSSNNARKLLEQTPKPPKNDGSFIRFRKYWMSRGEFPIEEQPHYIITPSVEANLLNLVRATSTRRYPVLLQGPTSSGKTSMVEYLAKISGNRFVRINNHEHTDLQEYLGTYVSTPKGLQYQEGILVRALKEGHWIVLDELNLAPTDVLEALNRLLDDNRELLIPETQEVVRPHENFMLFATQNPPGVYGGRKVLSRAFRNRFLELHFDDIPEDELEKILIERCRIAPQFGTRIVAVYKHLAILRQSSRMFEQKNSFATLRDLFRWALRGAATREELAIDGFMLLAERVRNPEERLAVQRAIEEKMKVKLDVEKLYNSEGSSKDANGIVWTHSSRRLFTLVERALRNNEPVLLVGGTGIGKTSICQAVADLAGTTLNILNANQNTETGDLIGSQRPLRNRSQIEAELRASLMTVLASKDSSPVDEVSTADLLKTYESLPDEQLNSCSPSLRADIEKNLSKMKTLFEWSDGNLVRAMKAGTHFLLDEISLADDSVLERLNSVLEPERRLLLAEKGTEGAQLKASEGFQFLATMNPGGDYGKKELSPALRNRFTEIWVPDLEETDIVQVVEARLSSDMRQHAHKMIEFASWFGAEFRDSSSVSLRETLSWAEFVNAAAFMDPYLALLHGAAMVYVDGLGASPSAKRSVSDEVVHTARASCLSKLNTLFQHDMSSLYVLTPIVSISESDVVIEPFSIRRRVSSAPVRHDFSLQAETTRNNAARLLRALQVDKPVLIEGSPGVGKTTLVAAIARLAGAPLTRINLSDQTDVMDLFGSDVPVENGEAGQFTWRDAPFLQAMQRGEWVLLDEMNLASQSVLEGLNACLDHRGEAYVPELDQTFKKHPDFRVFAAQNPHSQGGGRKGLPASFVNRFTVVFAETLQAQDLDTICTQLYPQLEKDEVAQMVRSVTRLSAISSTPGLTSMKGGPWEFNLRDILRWIQLKGTSGVLANANLYDVWDILFLHRLRDSRDTQRAMTSMVEGASSPASSGHTYFVNLSKDWYQCGYGILPVKKGLRSHHYSQPNIRTDLLESLMLSVQHNWPCLLIGASGSGKTAMIHHLASHVGAQLVELPLNADSDTMDLIGGYEQVDHLRKVQDFQKKLKAFIDTLLIGCLCEKNYRNVQPPLIRVNNTISASNFSLEVARRRLEELKTYVKSPELDELYPQCLTLARDSSKDNRARFEWVDGPLVQALVEGKWLVLDNANLCGPSVLDRLNSLLEPNGSLLINENRNSDGSVRVVRPHPDFRLFLTVDARYGEVSRAMRNRCIELHLSDEHGRTARDLGSSTSSSCFRFRPIQHFDWAAMSPQDSNALLSVSLEGLSFSDMTRVEGWFSQVNAGLIDTSLTSSTLATHYHTALQSLNASSKALLERIERVYKDVFSKALTSSTGDLVKSQSLQLLDNAPLMEPQARNSSSRRDQIMWYGNVFEFKMKLLVLQALLSEAIRSAIDKNPQHLSRLARAVLSKRHTKFKHDSTNQLENFFESALDHVIPWIDSTLDDTLSRTESSYFGQFVTLLWELFELSTTDSFTEPLFQAYLIIGRSLNDSFLERNSLHNLGAQLQQDWALFNEGFRLTTGVSMERLWITLKPITAENIEDQGQILNTEAVANDFDRLVSNSHASNASLSNLRRSLIESLSSSRVNLQEALQVVTAALNEEILSTTANDDVRYHHFQPEFEGLRQILASETRPYILDLLAGRSTIQTLQVAYHTTTSRSLYSIIDMTGIDKATTSLVAVKQCLPVQIIQKALGVPNSPTGAMDLVKEELNEMSVQLAVNTDLLAQDHLKNLNQSLSALLASFLELHQDIIGKDGARIWTQFLQQEGYVSSPEVDQALSVASRAHQDNAASKFFETARTYLLPASEHLKSSLTSDSPPVDVSATAWISFFVGALRLYIPDRVFDPALNSIVKCDRWSKHVDELNSKLRALQLYQKVTSGFEDSFRGQLVKQQIQDLGEKPEYHKVARPQISRLPQLQSEFSSVLTSVVKPCSMLVGGVGSVDDGELQLVRNNIARAVERLASQYREYDDIVVPAVGLLRGLDVGLALMLIDRRESRISTPQASYPDIFGARPLLGLQVASAVRIVSTTPKTDSFTPVDAQLLALKCQIAEERVNMSGGTSQPVKIQLLFDSLYQSWKQQLETDQEKHATKSSLYRYHGSQKDDEAAERREFEELFPDYEQLEPERSKAEKASNVDVQELAQSTAKLHRDLFVLDKPLGEHLLSLIAQISEHLSSVYDPSTTTGMYPLQGRQLISSIILSLNRAKEMTFGTEKKASSYNFYEDANISELQKLRVITTRIQTRFRKLKAEWPEHVTLSDVLGCVQELMSFRLTEPIAKVLTKVDKLHGYIYQWQVVASREFFAANLYDEVTDLIVSWRRLELSTWSRLLELEDEKCLSDSQAWWFIAYEAVVDGPLRICDDHGDTSVHTDALLIQLRDFLKSTSLGQYSARLRLMEAFAKHTRFLAKEEPQMMRVTHAIETFAKYYSRYETLVNETLSKGKDKIAKELKEVLLLASWKDTNINALRESAKRSHHKLFKIVRKYRTILAEPVEAILSRPVPPDQSTADKTEESLFVQVPLDIDSRALTICEERISDWTAQAKRYQDPMSTVSIMKRHLDLPADAFDPRHCIDSFSENLVVSIESLRKETPGTLTKENTNIVKHLKTRKRKVFADTLKELRRMGFKSNVDMETLKKQRDVPCILARVEMQNSTSRARSHLFSILDRLEAIREKSRTSTDDLTKTEVARSVGILESMLNFLLTQERSSKDLIGYIEEFDQSLQLVSNVFSPDNYKLSFQPSSGLDEACELKRLNWLHGVFAASATVLEKQMRMGGPGMSALVGDLHSKANRLGLLKDDISHLPQQPEGLSTTCHEALKENIGSILADFASELTIWKKQWPNASYILESIEPWIEPLYAADDEGHPNTNGVNGDLNSDTRLPSQNGSSHIVDGGSLPILNGSQDNSIADLQSTAARLTDTMLDGMEKLKRILNTPMASDEDSDWLIHNSASIFQFLKTMQLARINRSVTLFLDSLHKLSASELHTAAALCTSISPILRQYRNAYAEGLDRWIGLHTSVCSMASMLSKSLQEILDSGFCSPKEKSNDPQGSDKLEEGTGLGEGEGAEDISKDIQDDEDLSELAQEGNKDKEEIEEEDDAVDMGADELEGDAGDAEEKSDQGDEEQKNDESGDEMDEETGSVDDLDPTAIDEKMWDGKDNQEDSGKDKETDKQQGTKEDDLTAQNGEEEQMEQDDEDLKEAGAEESEEIRQEEKEQMDPHAPEEEMLDLPEDMNMDGGEGSAKDSEEGALDDLSDVEMGDVNEDERPEDDRNDDDLDVKDVDEEDSVSGNEAKVAADEETETPEVEGEPEGGVDAKDEAEGARDEEDQAMKDGSKQKSRGRDQNDAEDEETGDAIEAEDKNNEGGDDSEKVQAAGAQGSKGKESRAPVSEQNTADDRQEKDTESGTEPQPFQKLGDALEKWHRLNQRIQDATQDQLEQQPEEVNAENPNQEFEHLPDENTASDAQALGEATDEQAHHLDQEALDSEVQQQPQSFPLERDNVDANEDQDMLDAFHPKQGQAEQDHNPHESMIVDQAQNKARHTLEGAQREDTDTEDYLDDLDNDLSIVHLDQDKPEYARSTEEAHQLWSYYEGLTRDLALSLTEQLRLILAPTLASKMRGDFRTGKRLNIKRIIPYIASQYKRDKIWMRRSIPSKRNYQIMLALDDSKSMGESGTGKLAFETLALVTRSLSMLEVGQICVVKFGSDVQVTHDFEQPFSSEAGGTILRRFGFQQSTTNVQKLIAQSLSIFSEARAKNATSRADLWQLQLIISDGICDNRESIRRLLRQAHEERVMIVFVIVDGLGKDSIMDMKEAVFDNGEVSFKRYLDDFPFGYYLIVGDVKELPHVLATALRQWFAEIVEST